MIFDLTKGYAPEVYRESRDYRVFLRMLGMLISVNKDNIDSFINLYNAEKCPAELLPYLASMVGYEYDNTISVEANRSIIKYYPTLLRNRGSEAGLKLAVVLSVSVMSEDGILPSTDGLLIQYDREEGVIKIYYNKPDLLNWNLINAVRPLGMSIEIVPSNTTSSKDEFRLKANIKVSSHKYSDSEHKVNTSKVGFSDVFGVTN